jgi:hypothetical protein
VSAHAQEYEYEPVPGLPERLPAGERLLWQGSPDWRVLAVKTFHVRKVALYFAVLVAWRITIVYGDTASVVETAQAAAWVATLGLAAAGVLALLAWLYGRSTVYTITSKRVVMRYGVALPMALNIPFTRIASAAVARHAGGVADIPLALSGPDRISYLHLWPHVRPWRVSRPEPMLSAVPEGVRVAEILGRALQEAYGQQAQPSAADASTRRPSAEAARPLTAAHA